MNRRGGWTLVAAVTAPALLVGGWTLAASRQPAGYNPIRDTISALAAHGAIDRWIMTSALAAVGACYAITALGLPAARGPGRTLLITGGVATVLVAVFAQPPRGHSTGHTVSASVAFSALATWPLLAADRHSPDLLLRYMGSAPATAVMIGLLLWFVLELHGGARGLAERSAAGAEAIWPLAVLLTTQGREPARSGSPAGRGVPRDPYGKVAKSL
jgi:hypothetical membrane protein